MGNYFSSQQSDVQHILERLQRLENLDTNKDGYVSKEEYLGWQKRQQDDLEKYRTKLLEEKDKQYQAKISSLEEEINILGNINKELEFQLKEIRGSLKRSNRDITSDGDKIMGELSKKYIDDYIEEILKNKNGNSSLIPDVLERRAYRRILYPAIISLDSLFKTMKVELLNHQLQIKLVPKKEDEEETSDTINKIDTVKQEPNDKELDKKKEKTKGIPLESK